MARILLVGTATLDMVYILDRYPAEDDEIRAQGLRVCRGGNAANTAVVLAQLGHACSFFGALADAPETAVIDQDLAHHGVNFSACPRLPGRPPTSSIYLSGTHRTIVHYRNLPELTAERFGLIDLEALDWVHFEGRNVPELVKMLAQVRESRPETRISLELEKPRDGIEVVWRMVDLLICSRVYAQHHGHDDPAAFLGWMREKSPQAVLVIAWGESGAYGLAVDGEVVHCPAFPPEQVVDTLGAGDTFNAGLIGSLVGSLELPDALQVACRMAGKKCGFYGLDTANSQ
jgi:ketohexokinase